MIGVVLAAGSGRRLLPYTSDVPKTLVPVADGLTILDVILGNFASVGITDVAVVVGHAASSVRGLVPDLEERYGVRLELVHNERFGWNNAYSLWLARDLLGGGAVLVNGDTLHPAAVEKTLLAQRGLGVHLAVDTLRELTDEAMKVRLDGAGRVVHIAKSLPAADGEYIGVCLVEGAVVPLLAECLAETWQRDPQLFYDDAFQLLADRTRIVSGVAIGALDWVEVDTPADLCRAREIARRY
jgi:choline kinase